MKYKEAMMIGGPWDGRRSFIMAEVPEVHVPTFDPDAHHLLRPLEPHEQVVYKPHVYRLKPELSSAQCSVYVHADLADSVIADVLVQGYRRERRPFTFRLSDVYEIVQRPSGPQPA